MSRVSRRWKVYWNELDTSVGCVYSNKWVIDTVYIYIVLVHLTVRVGDEMIEGIIGQYTYERGTIRLKR